MYVYICSAITVSANSIDRQHSLVVYISHVWQRPDADSLGTSLPSVCIPPPPHFPFPSSLHLDWDGQPHPDDDISTLFVCTCQGIESLLADHTVQKLRGSSATVECYLWFSFG